MLEQVTRYFLATHRLNTLGSNHPLVRAVALQELGELLAETTHPKLRTYIGRVLHHHSNSPAHPHQMG